MNVFYNDIKIGDNTMKFKTNLMLFAALLVAFSFFACDTKSKRNSFRGSAEGQPAVNAGTSESDGTMTTDGTSASTDVTTTTTEKAPTSNGICLETGEINPAILESILNYLPMGIELVKAQLLSKVDDSTEKVLAEDILTFLSTHARDILYGTNADQTVNDFALIITKFKPDVTADVLNNVKVGLRAALDLIATILKKECKFTDAKQLFAVVVGELVKVIPPELNVKFLSLINDEKIKELLGSFLN